MSPERIGAKGKPIEIKVNAIPDQYQGIEWLAAKEIHLQEKYDISQDNLTQGSTITRTLTLEGKGVVAELLPQLSCHSQGQFNCYPEKPQLSNRIEDKDVVGKKVLKITYLFNQAGTVTIPEIKVHWFNTESKKEEVATLPERQITIIATSSHEPKNKIEKIKPVVNKKTVVFESQSSYLPWFIASFFASIWLVTLLFYFLPKRVNNRSRKKTELKKLQEACENNDPKEAERMLILLGQRKLGHVTSLGQMSQMIDDSNFKKQILILAETLYSATKVEWKGCELWQSAASYFSNSKKKEKIKMICRLLIPFNDLARYSF